MVGGEADTAVVEAEGEGRLEPRDERAVLAGVQPGGDAELDEPEDLGDADRGDGKDQARCLREPADDGELDEPARHDGGDDPNQHGRHERPLEPHVQLLGQGRGEGAELALGEVDDPVGPVDQDKPDSEQPVEHPKDHALEEDAAGYHGGERVAAADALAHEHAGGEPGDEDRGRRQHSTLQTFPSRAECAAL